MSLDCTIPPRGMSRDVERDQRAAKQMDEADKGVTTRLRRIEGQVQGLQRMLESGRECEEGLTQIMAVRSSLDQVGLLLIEHHIEHCVMQDQPPDSPVAKELTDALKAW